MGDESAVKDRRRRPFHRIPALGGDCGALVQRAAQRIDNPTQQRTANRCAHYFAGTVNTLSGLQRVRIVQQYAAKMVRVQCLRKAELSRAEAQHLVQSGAWQTGNKGDAIAHADYATDFSQIGPDRGAGDTAASQFKPGERMRRHG